MASTTNIYHVHASRAKKMLHYVCVYSSVTLVHRAPAAECVRYGYALHIYALYICCGAKRRLNIACIQKQTHMLPTNTYTTTQTHQHDDNRLTDS